MILFRSARPAWMLAALIFAFSAAAPTHITQAAPTGQTGVRVKARVFLLRSQAGSADFEATAKTWTAGLSLFQDLVKRQCDFDLSFDTAPAQAVDVSTPGLTLVLGEKPPRDDAALAPSRDGFKFYQYPLLRLLNKFPVLERERGGVTILMVDDLNLHCAFAFPRVQFRDAAGATLPSEIVERLSNKILVSAGPGKQGECLAPARQLAHELGHLFIEDDPPHTTFASGAGRPTACPADNLMADFVAKAPARGRRAMIPEYNDAPDALATGENLDAHQCEAIRRNAARLAF